MRCQFDRPQPDLRGPLLRKEICDGVAAGAGSWVGGGEKIA